MVHSLFTKQCAQNNSKIFLSLLGEEIDLTTADVHLTDRRDQVITSR